MLCLFYDAVDDFAFVNEISFFKNNIMTANPIDNSKA